MGELFYFFRSFAGSVYVHASFLVAIVNSKGLLLNSGGDILIPPPSFFTADGSQRCDYNPESDGYKHSGNIVDFNDAEVRSDRFPEKH